MRWSQPADRKVVDAVVAAFCDLPECLDGLLAPLSQRQWERSYHWLDASGLALYFLARIEKLHLLHAIPEATLTRLRHNLADNGNRSNGMWQEFIELNRAFRAMGIDYSNLKGFTLSPDFCPDHALRCQLDFDFLVDGDHLELCRQVLAERGYSLRGSTKNVREFKTDSNELADMANFYKPKQQRCVELHFTCGSDVPHTPTRDERLDRTNWRTRDGLDFPALSSVDQFIAQAKHLFSHLCSPTTRVACVLELKYNIGNRADDHLFWNEVRERVANDRCAVIAIGVACMLAADVFAAAIPAVLEECAVARLPDGIAMWVDRYGRRALLADFPGTKLHLLLREHLNHSDAGWKKEKRAMLLPLHRAPRIIHMSSRASLWMRLRGELYQLRFEIFRLRFHLVEGLSYLMEAARWRRYLKLRQVLLHHEPAPRTHTTPRPS